MLKNAKALIRPDMGHRAVDLRQGAAAPAELPLFTILGMQVFGHGGPYFDDLAAHEEEARCGGNRRRLLLKRYSSSGTALLFSEDASAGNICRSNAAAFHESAAPQRIQSVTFRRFQYKKKNHDL